MTTHQSSINDPHPMLTLRDITEVLIKHYGHHDGKYEVLLSFDIGVGPFIRPGSSGPTPTAFMSIAGLQLSRVADGQEISNPNGVVDAAIVNPAP